MVGSLQSLGLVSAVVLSGSHARPDSSRESGIRLFTFTPPLPTAENLAELQEILRLLMEPKKEN